MAARSELVEFRRAFIWLLCGMLIPSVALVAFGIVAITNERAAVERRLADDYEARLRSLARDLNDRLDAAAASLAPERPPGPRAAAEPQANDPLAGPASVLDQQLAQRLALTVAAAHAQALPLGAHLFATSDASGERRCYALVRAVGPAGEETLASQLDLARFAAEVPRLAAARFPRERASFRLVAPRQTVAPLAALRRLVAEVAPPGDRAIVAHLALGPPLDGFTLAAELPGDDPAAALAFRNRTLYIGLIVLLYTGIGIGFGLTIREMRRAYKLSRLKTDFVANISHELRTPLTSVRLFAETLKAGRVSGSEMAECLDLLSKESERLGNLVEKLLDWSRLESGGRQLQRERTEVPALLEQVNGIFRAQQLGASYATEVAPGLPMLAIDRDAISQVVLNLLHNAVKYTGDDKRILLRARKLGASVAIEVQDNGKGVRPADRKRIFDRFYRADDLLSRSTEGTGLGLAICKRIVELHGGKIELESHEGQGSTFRVLLPIGGA